jgi:hypothetical protein
VFTENYPDRVRRRIVFPAIFTCFFGLFAGGASAHFERIVPSARNEALGSAFVSVADDPSAMQTNPAGLALADTLGLLFTYHQPYGLTGLNSGYLAIALPTRAGAFGLSFHYLGLKDGLTENILSLGWARHIISNSQDASFSIGATLDLMGAGAVISSYGLDSRDNILTGSLGVLLRPFPMIGIGYSVHNIVAGDIDLVGGGLVTRVRTQQSWGLSYKWQDRVRLSLETRQDTGKVWRNYAGLEINTHPNLHLRGGINRTSLTGGFGVLWRDMRVDVGMVSHDRLGPTYVFSIGFLPKVKRPYVQAR